MEITIANLRGLYSSLLPWVVWWVAYWANVGTFKCASTFFSKPNSIVRVCVGFGLVGVFFNSQSFSRINIPPTVILPSINIPSLTAFMCSWLSLETEDLKVLLLPLLVRCSHGTQILGFPAASCFFLFEFMRRILWRDRDKFKSIGFFLLSYTVWLLNEWDDFHPSLWFMQTWTLDVCRLVSIALFVVGAI